MHAETPYTAAFCPLEDLSGLYLFFYEYLHHFNEVSSVEYFRLVYRCNREVVQILIAVNVDYLESIGYYIKRIRHK